LAVLPSIVLTLRSKCLAFPSVLLSYLFILFSSICSCVICRGDGLGLLGDPVRHGIDLLLILVFKMMVMGAGGVAQMVEHLHRKHEDPSPTKIPPKRNKIKYKAKMMVVAENVFGHIISYATWSAVKC
jgi:hypothetical protein